MSACRVALRNAHQESRRGSGMRRQESNLFTINNLRHHSRYSTFASRALDIKLFVTTVSGKAEVLDNPFRVRVWSKLPSRSPDAERYDISEYGLPNINATTLVKVRQETKSME
jgi:hypothetical protein